MSLRRVYCSLFNNIDRLADICYTYKRYENKINKFEFESAIRDILDMEGITNPDEIVKNFWFQVKEFYPELFKKEI